MTKTLRSFSALALMLACLSLAVSCGDSVASAKNVPADGSYSGNDGFIVYVSDGKVVSINLKVSGGTTTSTINAQGSWDIVNYEIMDMSLPSGIGLVTVHGGFDGDSVSISWTAGSYNGMAYGVMGGLPVEPEDPLPTLTMNMVEETGAFARFTLSCSAGINASVYYGIDGYDISTSSLSYFPGQEIVIAKNCVFKAAAYLYSFGPSISRTFSFASTVGSPSGAEWARTMGQADLDEVGGTLFAMDNGTFEIRNSGQTTTLSGDFGYLACADRGLAEGCAYFPYYIHRESDGRAFYVLFKFNYGDINGPAPLAIVGLAADGTRIFAKEYAIERIHAPTNWYYRSGAFAANDDGSFALAFSHYQDGLNKIALLECGADGSPTAFETYGGGNSYEAVLSLEKIGAEYLVVAEEERYSSADTLTLNLAWLDASSHEPVSSVRIPTDIQNGRFKESRAKWFAAVANTPGAGDLFFDSAYDDKAVVLRLDGNLAVNAFWSWDSVYDADATQLSDGDLVIGGGYREVAGSLNSDLALIRLGSSDLSPVWAKRYGGAFADNLDGGSVLALAGDGILVAGKTYSFGSGKDDLWLLRVPGDGGSSAHSNTALSWAADFIPEATGLAMPTGADNTGSFAMVSHEAAGLAGDLSAAVDFSTSDASLTIMEQH
jgi:hypothetical protein